MKKIIYFNVAPLELAYGQWLTNGAMWGSLGVNVEQANAKKAKAFPAEYVASNENTGFNLQVFLWSYSVIHLQEHLTSGGQPKLKWISQMIKNKPLGIDGSMLSGFTVGFP